jgi:hypothetical protein
MIVERVTFFGVQIKLLTYDLLKAGVITNGHCAVLFFDHSNSYKSPSIPAQFKG